jgi:hypothetical protein
MFPIPELQHHATFHHHGRRGEPEAVAHARGAQLRVLQRCVAEVAGHTGAYRPNPIINRNSMIFRILPCCAMKPFISSIGTNIRCIYEELFMIVQDFRSSDDKGVINALNMNFNSSPLILGFRV